MCEISIAVVCVTLPDFNIKLQPLSILQQVKSCHLKDFLVTSFRAGILSVAYLAIANLVRLKISFNCQISMNSQYLVSSPCAGLQVVTQSTHLLKDCHPQLVSNLNHSKMLPRKQLDCECMLLHPMFLKKCVLKNCKNLTKTHLTEFTFSKVAFDLQFY